jgi:ABC-type multidrug transport system ATPase subunit
MVSFGFVNVTNVRLNAEPTTGLHMADITKLVDIIQRLVSKQNTVIVIEHNLDVALQSDWIIDLGPEGGSQGGRVIAEGTPEQVASSQVSHTSKFLRDFVDVDDSAPLSLADISSKKAKIVSESSEGEMRKPYLSLTPRKGLKNPKSLDDFDKVSAVDRSSEEEEEEFDSEESENEVAIEDEESAEDSEPEHSNEANPRRGSRTNPSRHAKPQNFKDASDVEEEEEEEEQEEVDKSDAESDKQVDETGDNSEEEVDHHDEITPTRRSSSRRTSRTSTTKTQSLTKKPPTSTGKKPNANISRVTKESAKKSSKAPPKVSQSSKKRKVDSQQTAERYNLRRRTK